MDICSLRIICFDFEKWFDVTEFSQWLFTWANTTNERLLSFPFTALSISTFARDFGHFCCIASWWIVTIQTFHVTITSILIKIKRNPHHIELNSYLSWGKYRRQSFWRRQKLIQRKYRQDCYNNLQQFLLPRTIKVSKIRVSVSTTISNISYHIDTFSLYLDKVMNNSWCFFYSRKDENGGELVGESSYRSKIDF